MNNEYFIYPRSKASEFIVDGLHAFDYRDNGKYAEKYLELYKYDDWIPGKRVNWSVGVEAVWLETAQGSTQTANLYKAFGLDLWFVMNGVTIVSRHTNPCEAYECFEKLARSVAWSYWEKEYKRPMACFTPRLVIE